MNLARLQPILNVRHRQMKVGCNGFGKGFCGKPIPYPCNTQSNLDGPVEQEDRLTRMIERFRQVVLKSK